MAAHREHITNLKLQSTTGWGTGVYKCTCVGVCRQGEETDRLEVLKEVQKLPPNVQCVTRDNSCFDWCVRANVDESFIT
jgi:hypothetical protein